MTRGEIIEDFRYLLDFDDYGSVHSESILLAIKSLQAWEKVIEEIEQLKTIAENEHNVFFKAYIDGIDRSLEIINKHLGEVEE